MVAIIDTQEVPKSVVASLTAHLPYSLPLLRRLQFMDIKGGKTANSHVLALFGDSNAQDAFVVAYLDFSRGPETEMWLYSSMEKDQAPEIETVCREQIFQIFKRVQQIEEGSKDERNTLGVVLVGALHEKLLRVLEDHQAVKDVTGAHFKFIFREESLPVAMPLFDQKLSWSTVRPSDIPLVLSRTSIPRKERTLILLPSVAVISKSEPIAWGFLGPDGSLTSLHCEEEFRGKGLAKAVALKLFRGRVTDFSSDGFSHADVITDNLQSQGVC